MQGWLSLINFCDTTYIDFAGIRILLVFGYGVIGGLVILMSQINSLPLVIAIGCSIGVNFATMFSIPYALVGEYHVYFKVSHIC